MFRSIQVLLLTAILITGCAPAPAASVFLKEVPRGAAAGELVLTPALTGCLYDMTTELAPDFFASRETANGAFSPLSLWVALGVLREGATGETRSEIDRMMKLPPAFDSSTLIPELSASLNFLEESRISEEPSQNGILLTNGIFFDRRYAGNIKKSYWEKAADVWGTETAQVDFSQAAETREIIRQWVSDHTETFIDDYEAAFASDGTAILNIYNVLYLRDLWLEPFERLEDQLFHAPDREVTAPFMGSRSEAQYHDHATAQAAAFPGETGLRVWYLLPKDEAEPASLIPDLQSILSGGSPAMLDFRGPLLTLDGADRSLVELLKQKGYSRLFTDPELDGMVSGIPAAVSEIRQKTKLQLDESGVKAAAASEIGMTYAAPPPIQFIVDRPFLLVIEYQGLPLVISVIQDPTAE